jgi:serine/threonine protein kinase/tetratricopeptide (TPR) repeat protein
VNGDEALEARLFEVLGRLDEGADPEQALADVCADAPGLVDDLRRRLALLADMGVLAGQQPQPMPERLGRFRLLRTLGGGGMGVVHLAHDEDLDREVALKVIRPEHLYFEGARERFRREVGTVAKLAHPNVVPVYSVGEEGGVPYFAMEHVRGCSLAEALSDLGGRDPARLTGRDLARVVFARAARADGAEEGAPSPLPGEGADAGGWLYAGTWEETCLRIVRQVAGALDHAHGRGVLHRDIKPSNVMLTADGASRALLLDFGLASSSGSSSLTASSARLGSLPYMSPEQTRGELGGLDARCDVYGLGVTLFELLTLRQAFAGPSDPEVLLAIQRSDHAGPRELNPALSWEAETVCLTAMEADPARRYASAADLARDLDNVLSHHPVEARRAGAWLRLRRFVQRRPTASVAAALGAVLLIGGPSLYAWQQHEANERLQGKQARIEADAEVIQQQNDTLTAQAEDLRRRGEELVAQNEQIQAQSEQVRRQFHRALQAVDKSLVSVSDQGLQAVPGMTELRRLLLDDARVFYEELLTEGLDDPAVLLRIARMHQLDGNLQSLLGDVIAAEASQRRSLEVLQGLSELDPADLEVARDLALALRELGAQRSNQGDVAGGLDLLIRSNALQSSVLEQTGDEDGVGRAQLIFTLANENAMALMVGRMPEAVAAGDQAVALARELVAEMPDDPRHLTVLARALMVSGQSARFEERMEDAATTLQEAVETYDQALTVFAGHPELRQQLGESLGQLAYALPDDPDRALVATTRSYEVCDGLTQDFPESPVFHVSLALACERLAAAHATAGEGEAADNRWREARMRFQVLGEAFQDLDTIGDGLSSANLNYGRWLLEQGRLDECLEVAEEALAVCEELIAKGSTLEGLQESVADARELIAQVMKEQVGA